jgi:hypothetical protein
MVPIMVTETTVVTEITVTGVTVTMVTEITVTGVTVTMVTEITVTEVTAATTGTTLQTIVTEIVVVTEITVTEVTVTPETRTDNKLVTEIDHSPQAKTQITSQGTDLVQEMERDNSPQVHVMCVKAIITDTEIAPHCIRT